MVSSVYDLRSFYECRKGRIVQPLIQSKILSLWPELDGMRVMGCGYAVPYLTPYLQGADRVFAAMPAGFGVHAWAPDGLNRAALVEETELPIETESIDRILLIHALEFTETTGPYLQELWRTLKSTGRILIVVPNRLGLWSRAEWAPFGHGTPFSSSQMANVLRENLFIVERTEKALFVPPFRSSFMLRSFLSVEHWGRGVLGGLAGVHVIEASKQLYGGILAHNASKIQLRDRRIFVPSPAPGA